MKRSRGIECLEVNCQARTKINEPFCPPCRRRRSAPGGPDYLSTTRGVSREVADDDEPLSVSELIVMRASDRAEADQKGVEV